MKTCAWCDEAEDTDKRHWCEYRDGISDQTCACKGVHYH